MAEALADILGRLGPATAAVESCRLAALWVEIVDERVKKHTEAIKVRGRVLYVNASSPACGQELTFLKTAIISKFNERAGAEAIRDIKFKTA